jgi:hypothetical protein
MTGSWVWSRSRSAQQRFPTPRWPSTREGTFSLPTPLRSGRCCFRQPDVVFSRRSVLRWLFLKWGFASGTAVVVADSFEVAITARLCVGFDPFLTDWAKQRFFGWKSSKLGRLLVESSLLVSGIEEIANPLVVAEAALCLGGIDGLLADGIEKEETNGLACSLGSSR